MNITFRQPDGSSAWFVEKSFAKPFYKIILIELLNDVLRKIKKTRSAFPSEEASLKLFYQGLQNAANKWTMPIQNWSLAMNQFWIGIKGKEADSGTNWKPTYTKNLPPTKKNLKRFL